MRRRDLIDILQNCQVFNSFISKFYLLYQDYNIEFRSLKVFHVNEYASFAGNRSMLPLFRDEVSAIVNTAKAFLRKPYLDALRNWMLSGSAVEWDKVVECTPAKKKRSTSPGKCYYHLILPISDGQNHVYYQMCSIFADEATKRPIVVLLSVRDTVDHEQLSQERELWKIHVKSHHYRDVWCYLRDSVNKDVAGLIFDFVDPKNGQAVVEEIQSKRYSAVVEADTILLSSGMLTVGDGNCLIHAAFGSPRPGDGAIYCPFAQTMRCGLVDFLRATGFQSLPQFAQEFVRHSMLDYYDIPKLDEDESFTEFWDDYLNMLARPQSPLHPGEAALLACLTGTTIHLYVGENIQTFEPREDIRKILHHIVGEGHEQVHIVFDGQNHFERRKDDAE